MVVELEGHLGVARGRLGLKGRVRGYHLVAILVEERLARALVHKCADDVVDLTRDEPLVGHRVDEFGFGCSR